MDKRCTGITAFTSLTIRTAEVRAGQAGQAAKPTVLNITSVPCQQNHRHNAFKGAAEHDYVVYALDQQLMRD